MKNLKDRLFYARELRELTQAQLAKKSKCAQSAIGNVESGTRDSLRNIVLVARALQVSPDWLYDGRGPEPSAIDPPLLPYAPNVTRLPATAAEPGAITTDVTAYDPYTFEVIKLMNGLTVDQRAAAAARLKEFVGHLAPPADGRALSMAG